jgi:hypothetical protein
MFLLNWNSFLTIKFCAWLHAKPIWVNCQTKIKSSNHKQIEKNQENKPQHKNLSKKRGSNDLNKSSDYTTLPLSIKQYLNYTSMHLSTTTKNKLQRIKYNKVWNKNQLGTLFNILPKFESVTYTIWNSNLKWHQISISGQNQHISRVLIQCMVQPNRKILPFSSLNSCMHRFLFYVFYDFMWVLNCGAMFS